MEKELISAFQSNDTIKIKELKTKHNIKIKNLSVNFVSTSDNLAEVYYNQCIQATLRLTTRLNIIDAMNYVDENIITQEGMIKRIYEFVDYETSNIQEVLDAYMFTRFVKIFAKHVPQKTISSTMRQKISNSVRNYSVLSIFLLFCAENSIRVNIDYVTQHDILMFLFHCVNKQHIFTFEEVCSWIADEYCNIASSIVLRKQFDLRCMFISINASEKAWDFFKNFVTLES